MTSANFGFGKPRLFRHIMASVTPGLKVVYPPTTDNPESDEGPEFCIGFEKELAQKLISDPEWSWYFEFRGVDSEDPEPSELEEVQGKDSLPITVSYQEVQSVE